MNQDDETPSTSSEAKLSSSWTEPRVGTGSRAGHLDSLAILLITFFYFGLTALTRAISLGDTPFYLSSVLKYSGGRDLVFWDFGHLLWRPAIWTLYRAGHWIDPRIDPRSLVFHLLLSVNWIAGLGCLLLMARVVRRFATARFAVLAATTLATSQVFLNYLHTGTSYVPGLFFLLLALELATSSLSHVPRPWVESSLFGASLAIPVLLWLPYIFAIPGLLLLPSLLHGPNKKTAHYAINATIACAAIGFGAYASVALEMHFSSFTEVTAWFDRASHSIDHVGGIARAVFGFNRAWFEMGRDGLLFRRFLLHDPYAPVSATTLVFTGVWKIALTYAFLATIAFRLLRGSVRDHRILAFLSLTFLPVFAFGIKWQGGDMERYIAAFPAIVLAGACALTSRPGTALRTLGIAFVSALLIVNLPNDLTWVRDAGDRALASRLASIGPIPEGSYLFVFPSDPLTGFVPSSTNSAAGYDRDVTVIGIVPIGYRDAPDWRAIFASMSLKAWQDGKDVWICSCLLDPVPNPKWGWVEGTEPSVRWTDIRSFLSHLQVSERRGDFVQLPPTPGNVEFLGAIPPPPDR